MMIIYFQMLAVIKTLALIFVSLKWSRFSFVKNSAQKFIDEPSRRNYVSRQYLVRMLLLFTAMITDIMVYYVAQYSTALWLCGMCVLCIPFALPTKARKEEDYKFFYGEENK